MMTAHLTFCRSFRRIPPAGVWVFVCCFALLETGIAQETRVEGQASFASVKPYKDRIAGTEVEFDMVPIPGGKFLIGSPSDEPSRNADEGPRYPVTIETFWMGKYEVSWDEFNVFVQMLDIRIRKPSGVVPKGDDALADAIARPTGPYMDMSFGMGEKGGFPAIAMSHFAARMYCKWLSVKTGHYYRLPTEAEWEYACRAGTTTTYSFGSDVSLLGEYAWFTSNCGDAYKRIGLKKPNPWGLYDMHGNVGEWVLDQYLPDARASKIGGEKATPFVPTTKKYPNVVRGGGWDSEAVELRSAARLASSSKWNESDPDLSPSEWWLANRMDVGFRVVRPVNEPSDEEKARVWDAGLDFNKGVLRAKMPRDSFPPR
jgi:formylglycine-generating enzyme required for sulfatase activity